MSLFCPLLTTCVKVLNICLSLHHCANHLYAEIGGFSIEKPNLPICNIFLRALRSSPPGHHGNVKTNCTHQLRPGEKTRRRHLVMTSPENPSSAAESECSVSPIFQQNPRVRFHLFFQRCAPGSTSMAPTRGPTVALLGFSQLCSSQDWGIQLHLVQNLC